MIAKPSSLFFLLDPILYMLLYLEYSCNESNNSSLNRLKRTILFYSDLPNQPIIGAGRRDMECTKFLVQ